MNKRQKGGKMLIKAGVDISQLERNTRRALGAVDGVLYLDGEEVIVTSTFEGNHGAGSLHYANRAFDIRLPAHDPITAVSRMRDSLGADFDIVPEGDHIHIEYDPK